MHTAICQYCGTSTKEPSIEWNFAEGMVYFYCSSCKKMNKLDLKPPSNPFPKSRRLG